MTTNNTLQDKELKLYHWLIYYIFLGVIQALWVNQSQFPPLPLRFMMIAAVFAPIIFRYELTIFAFPFFVILRGNLSTSYQYLPDIATREFYIVLLVLFLLFHIKKPNKISLTSLAPLLIFMLYMAAVDMLFNFKFGNYVANIFFALIFSLFLRKSKDFHILSAAIIYVSAILAVYYMFMYQRFLVTWDASNSIERSGWSDPNYFSTLINAGFMVAILYITGVIKSQSVLFRRWLLLCVSILIFIAVTLTASRAGFICFVYTLIVAILNSKIKFKGYVLGVVLIAVTVIVMYTQGVFDVLLYRFFEQDNIDTGGGRTIIWGRMLSNFTTQPHINQLFGGGYWYRATLSGGAEMHNEFLAVLADYGIVGEMLFLMVIMSMVNISRKNFIILNLPVTFYLISIMSLSPFQNVYIPFVLIWIYAFKNYVREDKING